MTGSGGISTRAGEVGGQEKCVDHPPSGVRPCATHDNMIDSEYGEKRERRLVPPSFKIFEPACSLSSSRQGSALQQLFECTLYVHAVSHSCHPQLRKIILGESW